MSMARPLLADPEFAVKAAAGRADEINTCIACNQACLDHVFANRKASCLVNPRAGRETELVLVPLVSACSTDPACRPTGCSTRARPHGRRRGGRAGGLAAAASAAERGFAVTLFEKDPEVGGQFRLAMRIPGKEEFAETLRYFSRRLEVLGAEVRLSTSPTVAELAAYDDVVVATGVTPRIPDLVGVDHPSVVTYADVLAGRVVPGRRVAVVGAGGIGVDVSHFLTHDPAEDLDDWMAHWGVGDPALHPGGLTEPKPRTPRARGDPGAAQDHPDRDRARQDQRLGAPCGAQAVGDPPGPRRVVRPGRRRRPAPDRRRRAAARRGRPRRAVRGPGVGPWAVRRPGRRRRAGRT